MKFIGPMLSERSLLMIGFPPGFGLGTFWIGQPVPDAEERAAAVVAHAFDCGITYFDTAPLYGAGAAERRLGAALAGRKPGSYLISTKAGRRVMPSGAVEYDFSADGIRRSVEDSLTRLGLDRVGICFLHDPDNHAEQALTEAYPALEAMRAEGLFGHVGVGIMSTALPTRFIRETDIDVVLIAGRWSLLDHSAGAELLPAALERGVDIVVGGVFNSGILADPASNRFDMQPASPAVRERAARIAETCARHGVPVRAAALQFPSRHPAVSAVLAGCATIAEIDDNRAGLSAEIPPALWDELNFI
jgi:D-threo-aldose 1-dehydrogenase